MKIYKNIESLERDIHSLDLERQIAFQEIKSLKEEYKDSLKPLKWVQSALSIAAKIGGMLLVRKMVK